ncbi:MAG: CoA-binding protein [Leptospiraceae bacterium]|nr:CoA-binding protein [Leptospiraceae bacterium]MDW7975453.1 CoA-binding protein [Leptospiraceae bacterium]
MSSFDLVSYLRSNPPIALVGATNDKTKYGNVIFHDLLRKGYTVFPVNPRATTIDGYRAYKTLEEVAKENTIGLVVFVVPPKITLELLNDALRLNLKKVWIQPGAGDENVREFLEKHQFEFLMDACVMVMSRK